MIYFKILKKKISNDKIFYIEADYIWEELINFLDGGQKLMNIQLY